MNRLFAYLEIRMPHSATSPACQHTLLARSPVGQVSICLDCEVVHLSLDCLSVRLEMAVFLAFADMLLQAKNRLQLTPSHDSRGQEPAMVTH